MRRTGTRQQLIALWALSILVLAAAWGAIVSSASRSILRSAIAGIDAVLARFRAEFSANVEEIDAIVNSLALNPTIKAYLTEPTTYRRHLVASELVDYFISLSGLKPALEDIVVLRPDGGRISYYDVPEVRTRAAEALADRPYAYSLGMWEYGAAGRKLLVGCTVFERSILNAQRSEDPKLGIVYAAVDPSGLTQNLDNIAGIEGVRYVVYDGRGNVVVGNIDAQEKQTAEVARRAREEGTSFETARYRVMTRPLANLDGSITTVVDKRLLFRPVRRSLVFSAAILLTAVLLLVALYRVAVTSFVRPIDHLIAFVRGLRHDYLGRREARSPVQGNRDTILLSTELNSMLAEIERLTRELVENNTRLYRIEIAQKQSEIALLRSQINPHFLYNTLEVIRSIAVVDSSPDVERTARALARILRYSIKGYDTVRLADELAIVRDYVQIQDVRFQGRFETEYFLDDAALACRVPRMCLQPVVENAFVHGLEHRAGGGRLRIDARRGDGASVSVTVEDNGPGIEPAHLETLNQELHEGDPTPAGPERVSGIGLSNVNARIRLAHPRTDCGIRIASTPGTGTRVELRFPVVEERADA